MTDSANISNRLLKQNLTRAVRELAEDSKNVVIGLHTEDRMYERNISFDDAIDALRTGDIEYERTDERGDCIIRASKLMNNSRSIGAITAVVTQQSKLFLITVMWED